MVRSRSMDAAFLLRVRRSGGHAVNGQARTPIDDAFGFAPHKLGQWQAPNGAFELNVWVSERTELSSAFSASPDGVSFVVGDVRLKGHLWAAPGRWSEQLGKAAADYDPVELQRDLRGVFAAGYLSARGEGWIVPDMLGLRCIYYGESSSEFVFSSRAELVAQAIALDGQAPPRDLEAVCRLAFTSYWLGERTGFEGVKVAPPGVVLRLRLGSPSFERSTDILKLADNATRNMPVDEVVEQVIEDVTESLNAALARPGARHIIQLTGGKDSRLILAVALRSGLAKHFEYMTSGPDELLDVRIAAELSEVLGLHHEKRFIGQRGDVPFGESRRRFVQAVGGMVSGWEAPGPGVEGEVRVTGVCGELLRSFQKAPARLAHLEPTAELFDRQRFGRLGLLRPDIANALYAEIVEGMSTTDPSAHAPLDRMHSYLAGSRMRYTRLGPRQECSDEERILPLYSSRLIQAAMSMDPLDRQADILYLEVMKRCSSFLVNHRFTDGGWDERARARLGSGTGEGHKEAAKPRQSPAGTPGPSTTTVKEPSLMQSLYASPSDERSDFLADVFSDAANPIWSFLDRPTAVGALARWADLNVIERRELFGAASGAIWAERDPRGALSR